MATGATEAAARVPIRVSPYWPAYPPSVPQGLLLSLPHLEAFYGGAAGGGKTDLLLRAALQYADVPGYKALLLRRTYPELAQAGGLMDRSQAWLAGRARWNEQKHRWTFPSGAVLDFGYLHRSTDRYRYQGAEYDFIGFDELTHFDEADYRYLFSRLRRAADSKIPPRMRSGSNPGGRGHRWVKRRFIDKQPNPDDPTDTPEKCAQRIFVPARLADNPGIDTEEYRRALDELDQETRQQLLDGDWNAREPGSWVFDHQAIAAAEELGRRFDEELAAGNMPPPLKSLMACGVDWGDNHTVCEPIWSLERGGIYVPPGEIHTSRADLEEISAEILTTFRERYPRFWFGEERYDSSFAQSNRTFAAIAQRELGPHNPRRRTGRPNTYPVHFNKDKDPTIRYLRLLLNRSLAFVNGEGDGTRVLAISPRNGLLLDQMRGYHEDDFGKPVKGDDDAVDALIAGAAPVARKYRAAVDKATAEAKRRAEAQARKRLLPSQVG